MNTSTTAGEKKMYKVKIRTEQKTYPVYLGQKALDSTGQLISAILPPCTALVVSDKNVAAHYGEKCLKSLRDKSFEPFLEVTEGGEREIFIVRCSALLTRFEAGMIVLLLSSPSGGRDRRPGGICCATCLRGVLVQLPTTLLAMVDSSVGGRLP